MDKQENDPQLFKSSEIVGFHTHELSKKIKTCLQNMAEDSGEDPGAVTHGWLIGYLYDHRDTDIYQKDLEDKLHLAKSSIATILQSLEQTGYIRRETPSHDARQKKVVLTPKGCEFEQIMRRRIIATEMLVRQGIPEEDMKTFFRVMKKMIQNVDSSINKNKA